MNHGIWRRPIRLILLAILFSASNLATGFAQQNNPAFRARREARAAAEKLDWQIAVAAYSFRQFTFFDTVDKIAELGVDQVEGFNFQRISDEMPVNLDPLKMSAEQMQNVRDKLQKAGVRLVALYYGSFPADEAACRSIFEKSKSLGIRYFVSEPNPDLLPMLDRVAQDYGMIVGLHGHDKKSSPNTWHPELVASHCQAFSPAIGAFSDTGHWIRSELDPAEGARILKDRIVGFEIHDLHAFDASGRDVPLGTGVGNLPKMLETVARLKKGPVLFSVEYVSNPDNPSADVKKCIEFLDAQAIRLASSGP